MKYLIQICLLLAISYNSYSYEGKYPIQNFTSADYKAGIQNIDFAQNRNMTLFAANNLGVLAYNGNGWKVHAFESGKKKRSLAFDEGTNRLYVGSQGTFGYLTDNWNYISLMDLVPTNSRDFDEVWDIFLLNSKVYFCTFQGIYVYDGQSINVLTQKGGLDRSFLANGKLYIQNRNGKLYEIIEGRLVSNYAQKNEGQIIAGIIPQNEGLLLFYNSGLIEFSSSFGVTSQYPELVKTLSGKYVNHILQLSDSRLVISTQTAGLLLYDLQKKTIENITSADGLQTNACLRTFQDYSGNLWVGMQNGIALVDINSPMRFINQEINLQGSGYEAYELDDGTYFTTSNGIYYLAKDSNKSVFLKGTEGPAYGMQKIVGKLYAGHHTGLFILEKGKATQLVNTKGLWQIKQLKSNPKFAIGGTYSGLYLFKVDENLILQKVQKIEGFDESSRFFEEDQNGIIWVGQFYKGIFQLNLNETLTRADVEKIPNDSKLPIEEQIILNKIDNELYLATPAGVFQLDQSSNRIAKADFFSQEIPEEPVYLMTQDNKKNIHIISENFVGYYKQISSNNYAFVPSSLFQLRYSLNNDLLNVSVNTENGVLFNANEGFINYKPELENRDRPDNPLIIRQVTSVLRDSILYMQKPFEQHLKDITPLNISHKEKVLQFKVESFNLNAMNNQEFRFFLKGFDEDYGEWTNMPVKEYTNLTNGKYEFYAQTRNYFGEIITSQKFLFIIKPPFHRSTLGKICFAILGCIFLLWASRIQKQRYLKKAQIIEETKRNELIEKQKEFERVEKQKEQDILKLEEDKLKSEMQHLSTLLAASTMNLVVKNEYIETIKEKLKEVNKKGKNKETKTQLEHIVKDIDTTLKLQEDWKQFEYHFDQVHGDFLTRLRSEFVKLSPNEQKLCAFLRLNLNSKDIANLMGISLRGIEVARYRLRKKLDLDKGQNLSKFILEY